MKSAFIALITLSATMSVLAQMTTPQNATGPQKVAQPMVTRANVSTSANMSLAASQTAVASQSVANQFILSASSNASLAQSQAVNASTWANTTAQQLIYVNLNYSAVQSAQAAVQIAQSALTQAQLYSAVYNNFNAAAALSVALQFACSSLKQPSDALNVAIDLSVTSSGFLDQNCQTFVTQSAAQVKAADAAAFGPVQAARYSQDIMTVTAKTVTMNLLTFATSQAALVYSAHQATSQASAVSSQQDTGYNSAKTPSYIDNALTQQKLAQVAIALIGSTADTAASVASASLVTAQALLAQVWASYVASATLSAFNQANTLQAVQALQQSVVTAKSQAQLSVIAGVIAGMKAGLSVTAQNQTMIIANQRSMQSATQCSNSTAQIVTATQAKTTACKALPKKASAKDQATRQSNCNTATLSASLATQVNAQLCAL